MEKNLVLAYRILVILLLGYVALQLSSLKKETHASLKEIDMVISKLDYVESDINTDK